jgi:hypothetical protein
MRPTTEERRRRGKTGGQEKTDKKEKEDEQEQKSKQPVLQGSSPEVLKWTQRGSTCSISYAYKRR